MALAINVIDRHGPSNKMRCQLQPKKTKLRLYYLFIKQQKTFYPSFIANKMEHFSFKSGCVVRAEMTKCIASYSQRRLRQGCNSRLYSSKRRFSRLSLLSRRSVLFLKMGVSYGCKAFKRRLVHGVALTIMV